MDSSMQADRAEELMRQLEDAFDRAFCHGGSLDRAEDALIKFNESSAQLKEALEKISNEGA